MASASASGCESGDDLFIDENANQAFPTVTAEPLLADPVADTIRRVRQLDGELCSLYRKIVLIYSK